MPEYLRPGDITGNEPLKTRDVLFRYRGFYDREPEGFCRLRVFSRGSLSPVIVLSELPDNPSTSITNAMEF